MRDIDACAMLSAGHGVLVRFANALSDASHDKPAFASVDVDIKLNRCTNWVIGFRQGRRKDSEHCGEWIGILPRHNFEDRLALGGARTFFDERLGLAVALVNGFGPMEN